jgi:hypothetical protein
MSDQLQRRRGPLIIAGVVLLLTVIIVLVLLIRGCGGAADDGKLSVDAGSAVKPPVTIDATAARDSAAEASAAHDQGVERRRFRGRAITSRELRTVQRRHRGLVKLCYDRATRRGSGLVPRRINLTVRLAQGGRVRGVKVSAGGALGSCVKRMVRGWRFPRALKAQQVRFAFVFAR